MLIASSPYSRRKLTHDLDNTKYENSKKGELLVTIGGVNRDGHSVSGVSAFIEGCGQDNWEGSQFGKLREMHTARENQANNYGSTTATSETGTGEPLFQVSRKHPIKKLLGLTRIRLGDETDRVGDGAQVYVLA